MNHWHQVVLLVLLAVFAYVGGAAAMYLVMRKEWAKRMAASGGCPRCTQYEAVARYARRLVGVRLRAANLRGQNSEIIRNAVNGVAREAEWLPAPKPILLRREVLPREVPRA